MKCTGAIPVMGSVSVSDPCTSHSLLQPTVSMAQQVCTYKHKETLRKRCKDCYYIKRHNRWYVECRSKPRHKQMEKLHKSEIYRWYWHCLKQCDCLNNIVFDELWIISSKICIVKEVVIVLSFNQKNPFVAQFLLVKFCKRSLFDWMYFSFKLTLYIHLSETLTTNNLEFWSWSAVILFLRAYHTQSCSERICVLCKLGSMFSCQSPN